jgi:membrane-associated protease RseP (regulator of RpoE activity)
MSVELNHKDEAKVSQMLASLPIVQPPGDFDVRVRSRIAAGRPKERRAWFWPILAGATPLVLLLAIGSYFVFRTAPPTTPDVASAPIVEMSQPPLVLVNEQPLLAANTAPDTFNAEKMIAKAPDVDSRMVVPTLPARGPNVGGSIDQAITERRTINPRGIPSSSRQAPRPRDFDAAISIPIKDVLTQLGADSQSTKSGVLVVSVTNDGAAIRLGLKANDVIESIDDKPVNDGTSYKGKFAGKKMRVIRDGKPVDIDLSKP